MKKEVLTNMDKGMRDTEIDFSISKYLSFSNEEIIDIMVEINQT